MPDLYDYTLITPEEAASVKDDHSLDTYDRSPKLDRMGA